jgi:hypothetical protein
MSLAKPLLRRSPRHRATAFSRGLLLVGHAFLAAPLAHAETDIVVMKNGDQLTGEIKSLDRGQLSFETDATDTIEIKWEHVAKLVSTQYFEVWLDDGRQVYGSLADGAAPAEVWLSGGGSVTGLPMLTVVRMTPIEGRIIERIDMTVDVGYSLAKANGSAQSTIGYDFEYRDQVRLVSLNLDGSTTESESDPPSTRINTSSCLAVPEGNFVGMTQVERNDELDQASRHSRGGRASRSGHESEPLSFRADCGCSEDAEGPED